MSNNQAKNTNTYEAEVIDSSVIDESVFKKVLTRAGRTIAQPAIEAMELILDSSNPPQVRVTMLAALTYLIMPLDLMPDFIPVAGFSDDLVALTMAISLWSNYVTPAIRNRAKTKLDKWLPL